MIIIKFYHIHINLKIVLYLMYRYCGGSHNYKTHEPLNISTTHIDIYFLIPTLHESKFQEFTINI